MTGKTAACNIGLVIVGADSCKFNICSSIGLLCKGWADVFQMPHHRQAVSVSGHCRTTLGQRTEH